MNKNIINYHNVILMIQKTVCVTKSGQTDLEL